MSVSYGPSFYLASIKNDYKWSYLDNGTLVFAYQKVDKVNYSIVYWNTKTNERIIKQARRLLRITSCEDFIAIFTKGVGESQGKTKIDLCNAVGTPVDSKLVAFEGSLFGLSRTHVVMANENYVYTWQYKTLASKGSFGEGVRKVGKETCWFIGDKPSAAAYNEATAEHDKEAEDIIYSIFVNDHNLYVALESGAVNNYLMPHISLEASKIFIKPFPILMAVNSDNTRMAFTDIGGNLSILNISVTDGQVFDTEKKDVWQAVWSRDHPEQLSFMEKNKLTVLHNQTVEKFVGTDAVICQFKNLRVKGVYLDDLMKSPDGVLVQEDFFMEH